MMIKKNHFMIGGLAEAKNYHQPIDIPIEKGDEYYSNLKAMTIIRIVEEIIGENVKNNLIKCPCHLSIGQEAIPVAISKYLNNNDFIFGNHRSHGHYLAAGGSSYELFAEVLGKATGCARGMGGSMHITSVQNGFVGSVPIVSGTVPIAVGAGLSAQMNGEKQISVSYFGDGTTEEGVFHESLNLASKFKLPVLFVCENNLFSSHLHISERQPYSSVLRFGDANGIKGKRVDGNNIVAISSCVKKAIENVRNGNGPFLLEAVTYRFRGHVGHDENIDVGLQRKSDLALWKKRDPIKRTMNGLLKKNLIKETKYLEFCKDVNKRLMKEWDQAKKDPFPKLSQLIESTYATND